MMDTTSRLSELLKRLTQGRADAELLLALLAELGRSAAEDAARAKEVMEKQLVALELVWAELADWLREWPGPPNEPSQLRQWLHEFEVVGLAEQHLEQVKIADEAHRSIARAFEQALAQAKAAITRRKDHARFAQEATGRTAELGRDVPPWCWIRSGGIREWLASEGTALREATELWIDGLLHATDEAVLKQDFPSNAAFQHAYADVLRERLREVHLTRWTPAWSLDVVRSVEDIEIVPPELSVRLPHIDDAITLWAHEAGALWRGPEGAERTLTPATKVHECSIAELGAFQTELVFHEPTSNQDVWHGLTSLRRVAAEAFVDRPRAIERLLLRAEQLVDTFVGAFEDGGILATALTNGHQAFEQGKDSSAELEQLVRYALESRLELSLAVKSLSDAGRSVDQQNARLLKADDDLIGAASAIQLIDEEDYFTATEGIPLDRGAWWGARELLDRQIPNGAVESVLIGMAAGSEEPKPAKVIAFSGRRRTENLIFFTKDPAPALAAADQFRPPSSEPCAWLRGEGQPLPGQVALLLFNETTEKGVVAELRITLGEPGSDALFWRNAPLLDSVARASIRDAYQAVGRLTNLGIAPYDFGAHRFDLRLPNNVSVQAIEGRSVALPVALAFASIWTNRGLSPGIVATGAVDAVSGKVTPVKRVLEKAEALRGLAKASAELLVAEPNAEAARGSVRCNGVGDLSGALKAARLDLELIPSEKYPAIRACENRLEELSRLVEISQAKDKAPLAWLRTADAMARLLQRLAAAPGHRDLTRQRCWTALAYSHAGEPGAANFVLGKVDRTAIRDPEVRALRDIADVCACIDKSSVTEDLLTRLLEDIEELESRADHSEVLGRACGTLGRARMHAGDPEGALPFLRRGVEEHRIHQPFEVPRSRTYLAMALRMLGDLDGAQGQLDFADVELATATRDYSPEYEQACRLYIAYERARLLVALQRYEDAIRIASWAIEEAGYLPWPTLGVLRTRAWAYRMLGDDAKAEEDVTAMREMELGAQHIKAALVLEAEGYPCHDGEVY